MKKSFIAVMALFKTKTKTMRVINYGISVTVLLYVGLLAYPNVLFSHVTSYKNFTVYSTMPLSDSVVSVLGKTHAKLQSSEIYDVNIKHRIFVCNNYNLFSFLAPFSASAFACNYPLIHSIFIANADFTNDIAFKNDNTDNYPRKLNALLAHEITHSLIENRIGFLKFKSLETWKNEGYCDLVGYGKDSGLESDKHFLLENQGKTSPGIKYKTYYYAVDYLSSRKKMSFNEIVSSGLSLGDVLKQIKEE